MIWPFDPRQRSRRRGFTLLEALISMALVAMSMGAVMVTLAHSSANQRLRMDRLLLTEFAHSKLEEWAVAHKAATDSLGKLEGGWNWKIVETTIAPNPSSAIDASMSYSEITVQVWTDLQPSQKIDLRTIAARRRP
jgi:prepilin-type N-terminal cleavage/methylation domain-containing protein